MYVRKVDDQVLTFRVSGKLWNRSLIMSDTQTGSEWSHLLGRAMAGRLKGKVLQPIVSDMLTWSAWRKEFPHTTALDLPITTSEYTSDFYRDAREFVLGFEVAGKSYALSMQKLIDKPVHGFEAGEEEWLATYDRAAAVVRLFDPAVDGRSLEFVQVDDQTMRDIQTATLWNLAGEATAGPLVGKKLEQHVGIMSFRKAWQVFHPGSTDAGF